MKKLWVEEDYRRWLRRRCLDEGLRHQVSVEKKRQRNREKSGQPALRTIRRKDILPPIEIAAPAQFSLVDNPDGTIAFLNRVQSAARDHHIRIKLSDLQALGASAVAVFLSTISQPSFENSTSVSGDAPNDKVLHSILEGTGFFDHVHRSGPAVPSRGAGKMYRLSRSRHVVAENAMELSVFAMKQIFGEERKHGPSYSLLMETMGNTFDHASPNSIDKQQWWAAVYHDAVNQRACFTFVDHGVGILRSYRFLQRMKHWPGVFTDNGEKLRSLLLGQIPSRTKDKHRGRGLPKAYDTWKAGRIKNLVVIANDAYANAEKQEFKQLSVAFNGTIIYWEV